MAWQNHSWPDDYGHEGYEKGYERRGRAFNSDEYRQYASNYEEASNYDNYWTHPKDKAPVGYTSKHRRDSLNAARRTCGLPPGEVRDEVVSEGAKASKWKQEMEPKKAPRRPLAKSRLH